MLEPDLAQAARTLGDTWWVEDPLHSGNYASFGLFVVLRTMPVVKCLLPGTALVVYLSDLPNKVHLHHYIMMYLDRLQFDWIRSIQGWKLL